MTRLTGSGTGTSLINVPAGCVGELILNEITGTGVGQLVRFEYYIGGSLVGTLAPDFTVAQTLAGTTKYFIGGGGEVRRTIATNATNMIWTAIIYKNT